MFLEFRVFNFFLFLFLVLLVCFFFFFFFFFSSRRRHTRWNCDWSSDVCSSDLRGCATTASSPWTRCRRARRCPRVSRARSPHRCDSSPDCPPRRDRGTAPDRKSVV